MVVQVVQLILELHYKLGLSEQRLGACDGLPWLMREEKVEENKPLVGVAA